MSRPIPKILIGTPTYEGKNYCLSQFIANVKSFTYPSQFVDFVIFDNSKSPDNAKMINQKYGVKCVWKDYSGLSVIEKLALTHEEIRVYAINNDYDFVLHLESDVFPKEDVIEQLLWTRKAVVGVPYQLFGGGQRRVVTQGKSDNELALGFYHSCLNLSFTQHWFFDGKVKRCTTNGVGCTLIHKEVLKKFPFRFVKDDDSAPDTWWTRDLASANVPYYVHTGMLAFHWNKEDWLEYASLIQYDKTE
jgi:hypothetical protein